MITRRDLLKRSGALSMAAVLGQGAPVVFAQGKKSVLTIALPSTPETIDPHQFRSVLTGSVLACMCEGLVTRDPRTMELRPMLAESWRNVNPTTWELKLRRGVRFHNGEELTGESVKFTIDRAIGGTLNTLSKVVWPPSIHQEVQVVDAHTVRITTKVPDPILPNRLAAESLNVAPAKGLGEFREKFVTDRVIGTGPYRFVEFVVGERVVVEASPDYWGPKPATQRIVWQVIPDAATRVAALQRGAVDVILNLPIPLLPTVEGDPNLRVYSELGALTHAVLLNTRESPALKDRRVRQALNLSVDRPAILKALFAGRGQLLNGVVARQVTNSIDPGAYAYDPARAKQLLAQAGHPNGFELTLWQSIGRVSQGEELGQVIAASFEKIGVHTKLQMLEWAEYNKRAGGSLFKDAFFYAFVNGVWDPSYITQRFLPSYRSFRYFDAEGALRKQIEDHEQAFDPKRRRELAAQVQKGLHDEAAWVYLFQLDEIFGMTKKVKGFRMRPDHLMVVRDAYVEA
jgi:peptide/nickel transport system substrate-binding protein